MEIQWPLLIFSVLLGVTSGSFVFLAVGELRGKFRDVRFAGALIALICLAVGGCVSVLHMGHPERATHLLGNLGSGLSKELFVVAVMGIVALIYLVLAKKDYPTASKVSGVLGGVIGLVLPFVAGASYLIAARPAWDSIALPLMFLGAGLALGMTLMCGLVLLKGRAAEEGGFALKLALAGVLIMAVTTVAYVIWIAVAPYQAPTRSIERLISGDMAVMFWAGVVVIGIVVPVALTALACVQSTKGAGDSGTVQPKQLAMYLFAACACTAIGAVVIRIIMYGVGTSVEQFIYH
ncbi:dimethyl sulfoxide reductase anchor subunit family protein [Eggerthella sinensis]|uniref:dimethyl sulfoxide reductase anchor subunit family protein n=1 Tax=Eggerthella sinensis TaxID=242230 RepID=UPI001D0610D4|nr:DmsC/YnfH family molybdoenzyme membrane anchor subunit [Eggerthella sinensis]MCB7036595.1 dimethyl sulfoxide reductase anchor subunit [Eggerthella sinensis]